MMKKKFDDEVGMDNLIAVAFKYPRSERIAIMGFLADYAHEYDLEKDVVAKIYTLNTEKSEKPDEKHQAKHMPACFGYDKGIGLLRFLKEKGFVERSADPDSFLYFMGCLPLEPELLKPIGWMKKQAAAPRDAGAGFRRAYRQRRDAQGGVRAAHACLLHRQDRQQDRTAQEQA